MTELYLTSKVSLTIALLCTGSLLVADFQSNIENSNFTLKQDGTMYNYNRLRLKNSYTSNGYYLTFIGDALNYYGNNYIKSPTFNTSKNFQSDTSFATQSAFASYQNGTANAKIYRLYAGYEDAQNSLVFGVQNIPMGVGKFWTPTNIFNPQNSYALEPDEVFGVMALSYTRALSPMSRVQFVISQRKNSSLKYALRYKAFINFADVALDMVKSDDTTMLGFEIQGNLGESGIELQSEGSYIKSTLLPTNKEEELYQLTAGADYGFAEGLILTTEALYSSKTFSYAQKVLNYNSEVATNLSDANLHIALGLAYDFNIFLSASLTSITSLNQSNAKFFSPTLTYTLNDYNAFTLGAIIYNSAVKEEQTHLYYLKYTLSF